MVISHWLLVISHWSLVIGHWSLVISHWSLVIGHWSLVQRANDQLCLHLTTCITWDVLNLLILYFPIPNSQFPNSQFPIPNSQFPTLYEVL
ncbi:MAG: hypothetical protein F6K41_18010 [Symploca sp. SIO3E6]|nr:hypothetical protein [Caldora sp. SIO3E6]